MAALVASRGKAQPDTCVTSERGWPKRNSAHTRSSNKEMFNITDRTSARARMKHKNEAMKGFTDANGRFTYADFRLDHIKVLFFSITVLVNYCCC